MALQGKGSFIRTFGISIGHWYTAVPRLSTLQ